MIKECSYCRQRCENFITLDRWTDICPSCYEQESEGNTLIYADLMSGFTIRQEYDSEGNVIPEEQTRFEYNMIKVNPRELAKTLISKEEDETAS